MRKFSDTPLGKFFGFERKGASMLRQGLALVKGNPHIIETSVREVWNNLVGVPLYRRFDPGGSTLPGEITLDLTRRCNLKCAMCTQIRHTAEIPPELSWYDSGRELPLSKWIDVLDQVTAFRPRLHITGGEPLLYPGFRELIREAKRRRFFTRVTSNGTLLAGMADLLVSLGVEVVSVSLDGPEEVHDRIRGVAGAFRRTTTGAKTLLELRNALGKRIPLLAVICTVSKDSLNTLKETVPLALAIGADVLEVHHTFFDSPGNVAKHNRIFSADRARRRGMELILPEVLDFEYYQSRIEAEDLPLLQETLSEMRERAKGRLNMVFVPNLPRELIGPYYLDLEYAFPDVCKSLWKSCRIYPDGSVAPCLHVYIGNITERPLLELWNSPGMRAFRETINEGLFPACARCCSRRFT
ncbi:MAG TPA: radical SAM protein [Syntrophobacter fumaroxidans]|nr:radical SAM protein [Syntrophobacter fumaroxidans]